MKNGLPVKMCQSVTQLTRLVGKINQKKSVNTGFKHHVKLTFWLDVTVRA